MPQSPKIRVTDETWKRLNARKDPGDTFDDVLNELLEETSDEGRTLVYEEQ